jgi:hypothetical protein
VTPTPLDGRQSLHLGVEELVLLAQGNDAFVDRLDLCGEQLVDLLGAFEGEWQEVAMFAVAVSGAQFDQLLTTAAEFGEFLLCGRGGRRRPRLGRVGVGGNDRGVDPIGFAELAQRASVVADAMSGHDADEHASLVEGVDQALFVAAGGFHNDLRSLGWGDKGLGAP